MDTAPTAETGNPASLFVAAAGIVMGIALYAGACFLAWWNHG